MDSFYTGNLHNISLSRFILYLELLPHVTKQFIITLCLAGFSFFTTLPFMPTTTDLMDSIAH